MTIVLLVLLVVSLAINVWLVQFCHLLHKRTVQRDQNRT